MRIRPLLLEAAAAILAAGCGSNQSCPTGPSPSVSMQTVCKMLQETVTEGLPMDSFVESGSATCNKLCGGLGCAIPDAIVQQVQGANPGVDGDASADGGAVVIACPAGPTSVTISCADRCTGRRTEGCAPAPAAAPGDTAARLCAMAHLEAVSVDAFARLERELGVHGAPAELRRDARRARRDEIRHTAMMRRLARQRGGRPGPIPARAPGAARSLLEIAVENAIEGCVRETYGAVAGLVEARTSQDAAVRRVMASIAQDECRHAELAWAVHEWALPRLSAADRRAVLTAMRAAIEEIATRDPYGATRVFRTQLIGGLA